MAKNPSEWSDFYKRMLEAKARKKAALEQKRLRDEFITNPDRFIDPLTQQPVVIKTEAEQKMDAAFVELQAKLRAEHPTPQDKLQQAFTDIARKATGL